MYGFCHELDFSLVCIVFIFLEWSQSLYHIFFHGSSIHPQNLRVFMTLEARGYHQKARVNINTWFTNYFPTSEIQMCEQCWRHYKNESVKYLSFLQFMKQRFESEICNQNNFANNSQCWHFLKFEIFEKKLKKPCFFTNVPISVDFCKNQRKSTLVGGFWKISIFWTKTIGGTLLFFSKNGRFDTFWNLKYLKNKFKSSL